MEFGGLEDTVGLVEEHHEGGGVGGQREDLLGFRNGDGIEPRAGGSRDFHVHRNVEDADAALDFLRLLHGQFDLMLVVVVGIAQVKFRGAGTVQPLAEELIHIDV